MIRISTFSHPDYTVGFGFTPNLPYDQRGMITGLRARLEQHLSRPYRRSGIAPCPEGLYA